MRPALSEEQRQAVQEQPDRPVEVVDPATNRTYVLLSQDLFEQIRSPVKQAAPEQATASAPAEPSCGEVGPLRQPLKDLPTPPEVAEEVARRFKGRWLWCKSERRELEEMLKLSYYYGGQCVAFLNTKEGFVIVAAAERRECDAFDQQLAFLTPEERSRAVRDWPSRFDETDSIL